MDKNDKTLKKLIDAHQEEMIESLQQVIRFPSVSEINDGEFPFGKNVQGCLLHVLDLAEKMGFKTCNVDNHVGWCEYGDGEEMIAVLGHLDVVPAGDGWSVPPYDGTIQDGKIYGRGTMDDKGPTIAALYSLLALKESQLTLKKRIRIIFGLSEENGGNDISYYVKNGGELPVMGFTPDGEYPVIHGEKGFIIEHYRYEFLEEMSKRMESGWCLKYIRGGTTENIVPHQAEAMLERIMLQSSGEKMIEKKIVSAEGISAHAATPWEGENAIQKLLLILSRLPLEQESKQVVDFLSETFKMEHNGEFLGIAMEDEISGPLTMNLGMISGEENYLEVGLNYRYPVTASYDACEPIVKDRFAEAGFYLTEQEHDKCLYMPADSEIVKRLMKVYWEETGREDAPKCIGGATYAKALPNVLAFGPVFPEDEIREHKPDEYVEIDWLMRNAVMIAKAMYELAKD